MGVCSAIHHFDLHEWRGLRRAGCRRRADDGIQGVEIAAPGVAPPWIACQSDLSPGGSLARALRGPRCGASAGRRARRARDLASIVSISLPPRAGRPEVLCGPDRRARLRAAWRGRAAPAVIPDANPRIAVKRRSEAVLRHARKRAATAAVVTRRPDLIHPKLARDAEGRCPETQPLPSSLPHAPRRST